MTTGDSATTPPPGPRWWISDNGKTDGPYSQAYIAACLAAGQYSSATMLCLEGSQQWKLLDSWSQFGTYASTQSTNVPVFATAAPKQLATRANTRLPQNVEYAVIYAKVLSPIIFVIGNLTCLAVGSTAHPESPLFGTEVMLALGGMVMELITRGLMMIGAFRIAREPRPATGMMIAGAATFAMWTLAAIVIHIAFASIVEGAGHGIDDEGSGIELLLGVMGLLVVFAELAYVVYMALMLSDFRSRHAR